MTSFAALSCLSPSPQCPARHCFYYKVNHLLLERINNFLPFACRSRGFFSPSSATGNCVTRSETFFRSRHVRLGLIGEEEKSAFVSKEAIVDARRHDFSINFPELTCCLRWFVWHETFPASNLATSFQPTKRREADGKVGTFCSLISLKVLKSLHLSSSTTFTNFLHWTLNKLMNFHKSSLESDSPRAGPRRVRCTPTSLPVPRRNKQLAIPR